MYQVTIKKAGSARYEIDFAALPQVSQDRVIRYGLTQILSDAAASVATSVNVDGRKVALTGAKLAAATVAAKKEVDERLADLTAGIVRRTREGDPVASEEKRLATLAVTRSDDFKAWLSANGLKAVNEAKADNEKVSAERETRVAAVIASGKFRAMAERNAADMAELSL